MAFRKFSQPTPMRAAKFEGMPNLISSIQQNRLLTAKKKAAEDEAQQKVDKQINDLDRSIAQGAYVQDQEAINELAKTGVNEYISDLNKTGRVSAETSELMQQSEIMANKSKKQFGEFQTMKTDALNISKNDPYFNYTLADAKIRNEEVKTIDQRDANNVSLEGDEYFLFDKYKADYISEQNKTVKRPVFRDGKTAGHREVSGQFLDDKGNINVTDQDAQSFLNSEYKEKLHDYYNSTLDAEYDTEVASIRAGGEAWTKGLTHNEIKTALINNPELNTMDSRTFAERKLEMTKNDLREGARIDKLTNTNFVDRDTTKKPPGGTPEERLQIQTGLRNETLNKIVYSNDEDALAAAFGGLKGVSNYQFYYEDLKFPDYDKKGKVQGITLMVPDPETQGDFIPKDIPLKTKKDKREARVILNKYLDDEVKGTANYIGPERIIKANEAIKQAEEATVEYSAGDTTYTHKKLIDEGYTEEQIQQAIELGNIKVKK